MEPFTLTQAAKLLVNESFAWEKFEEMRWPGGAECPHCRSREVRYLPPRSGTRPTSTGKVSYRRVWRCSECKKQFSALVGTIFEGSKIPIGKWMMAVYLMCSGKNGVSAHELHRDLQITYKSAWFMTQRIRKAMDLSPAAELFTGNVVADETWVGGEPKFRHANKRVGSKQGKSDKTPVVSLVNIETGEIRSAVVDGVSSKTLGRIVTENVEIGTTTLHSDAWRGYVEIGGKMAAHHVVDHKAGQYVTEKSFGTNVAEGYFSQLKRSIDGTHHEVSPQHLQRYVGEFDFRYSTRKMSDGERAVETVERSSGRYLSYRNLISEGPVALGVRQRPPGRPGPRKVRRP